ncbi:MAG: hypothetical protein GTN89_15040 [Acidobacteria bacterium]|nr:hypothetical protein [Acidobacteriota bacterium]NIM61525.1 hypothetical protein [Acidobacteriota bacterium]NIO60536.1 hypothetical protein [Acidobacteriota bacterium]NIQ31643.1 hypothetical protein [Acidobacteriota bacterium]NIQ86882.1 hypothetical protein [Acidobacteriota bacterium]
MKINNSTLIPIVKSLLDQSGMHYFIKNERQHDLVGYVRFSSGGYNSWWQPEVMVESTRAEEARELLLAPLEEDAPEGTDGQTSYRSVRRPSGLIVLGMWILFAPMVVWQFWLVLSGGVGGPQDLLLMGFVVLFGSLLWRVTGNYLAAKVEPDGEFDP